jgi:predicted O-methyltransferase YrrM
MNFVSDTKTVRQQPRARGSQSLRAMVRPLFEALAAATVTIPSGTLRRALLEGIYKRDWETADDWIGKRTYGSMTLERVPFDLEPTGQLEFEDLAGLLPSTPLAYGVALMTPRQLAYLFGLARRSGARTAIEIGRYKGGGTIALAAGMGKNGTLWSMDNGSLEVAWGRDEEVAPYDDQIRGLCDRFALDVRLLVGDSRTLELDVDTVDLVLIDGDHSYEGVKSDFERWGKRVRVGGHVLLDDAYPLGQYRRGCDDIQRIVQEAIGEGAFRLARVVDRLADLERIAPQPAGAGGDMDRGNG